MNSVLVKGPTFNSTSIDGAQRWYYVISQVRTQKAICSYFVHWKIRFWRHQLPTKHSVFPEAILYEKGQISPQGKNTQKGPVTVYSNGEGWLASLKFFQPPFPLCHPPPHICSTCSHNHTRNYDGWDCKGKPSPDPEKIWDIIFIAFKPINVEVLCYTAVVTKTDINTFSLRIFLYWKIANIF